LLALVACERSPFKRVEQLDVGGDTITLPAGVAVHEVQVQAAANVAEFSPAQFSARSGDVIRYKALDGRTHVLQFEEGTLPAGAADLFRGKSQLRSPPLVSKGASWVVSLEGAPAGTYDFRCTTHNVAGRFTVEP
jgi:plastocyanin